MNRAAARIVVPSATIALLLTIVSANAQTGASKPAAQAPSASDIPAHPRDLHYREFKFDVPKADKYRFKLKNGIVVYVAEDHALPLVAVSAIVRTGAFLDPPGEAGLASLTGTMLRQGGAGELTAEQFDEKVDFLAADIGSSTSDTQGGATLSCLTSVLDPSLDLFFDMLRAPRFQQNRIDIEKGNRIEDMKQRNDDAGRILGREWRWLLYGESHFSSHQPTNKDVDAISRDDLVDFHKRFWRPENMILAVSGDVSTKQILADLEKRFSGWKTTGPAVPWPPSPPAFKLKPGLYHVEKDIPQGKVYIGHLASRWDRWDNPDNFALMVMNDVLGGGGFTSRITKKVRSDEGLAYSAGSAYSIGVFWPGDFHVSFQSKNTTVPLAAKYSLAEVRRMRQEPVSDEEMTVSKNSFIEPFPRQFDSAAAIVRQFSADDYLGRPHTYWEMFRDNIRKVTQADVQRVAKTYLDPDNAVFLVVGKWSEIEPGDAEKRASMKEFFNGRVTHLPLRDPLTLKPKE